MNRIDGMNPLSTSRTQQGAGVSGVDGQKGRGRSEGVDASGAGHDNLSLSSRGREVADAARAVAQSPDVRAAKVAALKAAIADGSYTSDPRQIAARLLSTGTFGE
ncbi:MAG: flagellar biosynthesis anti-sigma factor FlgM [Dehalococcoidia bacterium]|nr:flagellar biosynthesis anti-sigma factor FlgM [Dehalococcoidia bacterium]